jgi:hypothetical protein
MRTRERGMAVPREELRLYRSHTLGLLRRYFRMSIELGRLPALVGREFFRARVSSYRAASFEDLVIFVTDVERCVETLAPQAQRVIAQVIFQEYTLREAAGAMGCNERTVRRQLAQALDSLAETFLERGLLRAFPLHEKGCQGGARALSAATH